MSLDDLFRRSSIVSVHAPLLPETTGLVGSRQFDLMSPGSALINTARGAIVDNDALVRAVRAKGVRAILDVTAPEPLPADHPLRGLPGVILTPHVAGSLGNELRRLGESAVCEVELLAAGRPPRSPGALGVQGNHGLTHPARPDAPRSAHCGMPRYKRPHLGKRIPTTRGEGPEPASRSACQGRKQR